MGYEIHFDDGTPESVDWVFALGSASDLDAIRAWVGGLTEGVYPRLRELVDALTTRNTMELGVELEFALDDSPPPAWLRPILDDLQGRIGVGDEGETATIGDDFPRSRADREACEDASAAGENEGPGEAEDGG